MQGYFVVSSNQDEQFDIKCELHPDYAQNEIPSDQQELYTEVESTNNIIKSLHNTKNGIKSKYFRKLLSLSQAGLVGNTAQPGLAKKSLDKLKEEMILIEGQRIKNEYMSNLGIKALILSAIIFSLYIVCQFVPIFNGLSLYCIVFIGAQIGTWISFGARKFSITFEQLSLLEEDMMSPWVRLLYIGACSIVLVLFLKTQLFKVQVGDISTDLINSSIELQLSVGFLCGLVESKIGLNLYKKAVNILSSD